MNMYLLRQKFNRQSTEGIFLLGDVRAGFSLEDRVRELGPDGKGKIPKQTAIPAGRYEVVLTESTRFKKVLPLLLNVPFFDGVRIHGGNTHEDTEGCPLVAASRVINKESIYGNITDSVVATLQGKKERHWIEVINCWPGILQG
jgi:hypothetical protein